MRRSGVVAYWASLVIPEDGSPAFYRSAGDDAIGLVRVTAPHLPLPTDAEHHTGPRHVYEIEPGRSVDQIPPGYESVIIINQPWTVAALAALYPTAALYCLEAEWLDEESVLQRGKVIEVPDGVTPTATLLAPHEWAGDGGG